MVKSVLISKLRLNHKFYHQVLPGSAQWVKSPGLSKRRRLSQCIIQSKAKRREGFYSVSEDGCVPLHVPELVAPLLISACRVV